MVLYVDVILFMNFAINYCFLELIYILFNEKIKIMRIIISSLLSLTLLFAFFTNHYVYNIVKIGGGFIIILIGIKFVNKFKYIVMVSLYYILEFAFIGILQSFNIKGIVGLLFLFIICVLMLIYSKRKNIFRSKTYKIIIEMEKLRVEIEGFLDTGNTATYKNIPIIFIDNKYFKESFKVYNQVLVSTVNSMKYINCYKPNKVFIYESNKKIEKECLIAFCNLENTECLLNNLMFC